MPPLIAGIVAMAAPHWRWIALALSIAALALWLVLSIRNDAVQDYRDDLDEAARETTRDLIEIERGIADDTVDDLERCLRSGGRMCPEP